MKIAFATDDGSTISQHFGRAIYYAVLEIEDGRILRRELRDKPNHNHFADHSHHAPTEPTQQHGMDPAAQARHGQMAQSITDCEALICRGMGRGAYESMKEHGIRPLITDIHSVEDAALLYARGELVDHIEKLH
jgi:predicted Fe-Mo cluster-binding NifX family protein